MLKLLLITFTSLLFTACGGGAGSSHDPAPQPGPNEEPETKNSFRFDTFSSVNSAIEDQVFTLDISYSGTANISAENLPSWITLDTQTPNKIVIQGTPNEAAAGQTYNEITLIADDNGTIIRSQLFQIDVTAVDDAPIIQTQALEFVYGLESEFTAQLDITDIDSVIKAEDITLIGSSPYIEASLSDELKITIAVSDMEKLLMGTNNHIYINITDEFGSLSKNIPFKFIPSTPLTAQSNFSGTISRDKNLTISFNQPMDINELTTSATTDCEGNIQISPDGFNTCLPIYPAADNQPINTYGFMTDTLLLNVNYQLKIKSTVTSLLQDTLKEDVISSFTPASGLMITEINSIKYSDDMHWFEIYNASITPLDLTNYSFNARGVDRASCTNSGCDSPYQASFNFPAKTIQPGQYMVVRAQHWDESYSDTDRVMYIGDTIRPYWDKFGYIEIINMQTNSTTDFVLFGDWGSASKPTPITPTEWSGSYATGLTLSYNSPLIRDATLQDNNNQNDWTTANFSTPAGPNDVECSDDIDQDGIPDCSEVEGSTFAGISLYQLGARVNQRDIFIEVDYMDSNDEGVIPRQEALQKVVNSFANKNIAVHFDVGDLFDQAEGINPVKFDLGGGNQVPFSAGIGLNIPASDSRTDLYDIKRSHFNFSRLPIFHYMLMANSQEQDGSSGSSGIAEINANDFLISLGGWELKSDSDANINKLINIQASTIMHELGHNLGLLHGGDEERNNKPNYLSIMNYLYQLEGLPTVGDNEGDRFYYSSDRQNGSNACSSADNTMTNPVDGDYNNFIIDYSDGSSAMLNEGSLLETTGLLRAGSTNVDFNCDKTISSVSFNQDINFDGQNTLLSDNNDWGKIRLNFQKARDGAVNGISLHSHQPNDLTLSPYSVVNDEAQVIYEEAPTKEFFDMIRER